MTVKRKKERAGWWTWRSSLVRPPPLKLIDLLLMALFRLKYVFFAFWLTVLLSNTVYLVIFLGEWDKKPLISSHLSSKWPSVRVNPMCWWERPPHFCDYVCLPSQPPLPFLLFLICRLWSGWLSWWFTSDRRLVFLTSPFENAITKVRYTVPLLCTSVKISQLGREMLKQEFILGFDESVSSKNFKVAVVIWTGLMVHKDT